MPLFSKDTSFVLGKKIFSAEQAAEMIIADAADADDGDSDLPADSGSEIESEP